ncbi:hemolysin XhlA family protein [Bacillus paralicheniformis]|uniref:hemolysin XhlA family protein n=1 Tax=Bacillus paralicheniformis TaxID=1648923 RepID=UPI0006536857|nr:hemolysin XhlA family protein [Bacillus paralicheniformis]AYQ17664.1 holin [Bacillus paralicheniformis]KND05292.1 holin [Bacillus paralicheniformis]KRT90673.1 holin [Bacillus paralicheniformis]MCV9371170.1 hemolysin XhlA family protein [Bacillus paralicheniformis]MDI0243743.1 hemolysin XhlA family protein [Bacillus paralicheniformis]
MGESSNNEMNDKIADIREWLVRIDTKVDYFNEVKHTADRAHEKADEALVLAKESQADISDMKANTKWLWGVILTVVGLAISGIALFL